MDPRFQKGPHANFSYADLALDSLIYRLLTLSFRRGYIVNDEYLPVCNGHVIYLTYYHFKQFD